jgi:broad specificity phosphatase PhoE
VLVVTLVLVMIIVLSWNQCTHLCVSHAASIRCLLELLAIFAASRDKHAILSKDTDEL